MRITKDADLLLRADEDIRREDQRRAKADNKNGLPVDIGAKALALAIIDGVAYVATAAGVVKKILLQVIF